MSSATQNHYSSWDNVAASLKNTFAGSDIDLRKKCIFDANFSYLHSPRGIFSSEFGWRPKRRCVSCATQNPYTSWDNLAASLKNTSAGSDIDFWEKWIFDIPWFFISSYAMWTFSSEFGWKSQSRYMSSATQSPYSSWDNRAASLKNTSAGSDIGFWKKWNSGSPWLFIEIFLEKVPLGSQDMKNQGLSNFHLFQESISNQAEVFFIPAARLFHEEYCLWVTGGTHPHCDFHPNSPEKNPPREWRYGRSGAVKNPIFPEVDIWPSRSVL